jgi:hypothetical protein
MKKQTMTALDQAQKSSDHEQTALLQAHESLKLEETATAKASHSAERENYMLHLMTVQVNIWLVRFLFPFKPDYLSLFKHLLCCSSFLS